MRQFQQNTICRKVIIGSTLPRVRLIHRGDLARDGGPFHFAAEWSAAALALEFFPFEKFVSAQANVLIGILFAIDSTDSGQTYENLK